MTGFVYSSVIRQCAYPAREVDSATLGERSKSSKALNRARFGVSSAAGHTRLVSKCAVAGDARRASPQGSLPPGRLQDERRLRTAHADGGCRQVLGFRTSRGLLSAFRRGKSIPSVAVATWRREDLDAFPT